MSGYHTQTDGLVEKFNSTLGMILKSKTGSTAAFVTVCIPVYGARIQRKPFLRCTGVTHCCLQQVNLKVHMEPT